MLRRHLTKNLVAAIALTAFLAGMGLVSQSLAQSCPKTCPMKTGAGSSKSCPLLKANNPDEFLGPYFEMRSLLCKNKTDGLSSLSKKLYKETQSFRSKLKKAKGSSDQLTALAKIERAAETFKAKDLEKARENFKTLSSSALKYVQGFGYGGPAYAYYCDTAKAAWLQEDDKMGNPYYGPEMPKCGALVGQVVEGKYLAGESKPVKLDEKPM